MTDLQIKVLEMIASKEDFEVEFSKPADGEDVIFLEQLNEDHYLVYDADGKYLRREEINL